jgi:hypothetical protein
MLGIERDEPLLPARQAVVQVKLVHGPLVHQEALSPPNGAANQRGEWNPLAPEIEG